MEIVRTTKIYQHLHIFINYFIILIHTYLFSSYFFNVILVMKSFNFIIYVYFVIYSNFNNC